MEKRVFSDGMHEYNDVVHAYDAGLAAASDLFDPYPGELADVDTTQTAGHTLVSKADSRIDREISRTCGANGFISTERINSLASIIQEQGFAGSERTHHTKRRYPEQSLDAQRELVENHLRAATWFVRASMGFDQSSSKDSEDGENKKPEGMRGPFARFTTANYEYGDRLSVAVEYMIRTARKFKPGFDTTFSGRSYADMEGGAERRFRELDSSLSMVTSDTPRHQQWLRYGAVEQDAGEPVSAAKVSFLSGIEPSDFPYHDMYRMGTDRITPEQLDAYGLEQAIDEQICFDSDLSGDEYLSLADRTPDLDESLFQEGQLHDIATMGVVDSTLGALSDREQYILELRFFEGLTLESIGNNLGLTRERIRQLEARALVRMGDSDLRHGRLMRDFYYNTPDEPSHFNVRQLPQLPHGYVETHGLRESLVFSNESYTPPGEAVQPETEQFAYQEDWDSNDF